MKPTTDRDAEWLPLVKRYDKLGRAIYPNDTIVIAEEQGLLTIGQADFVEGDLVLKQSGREIIVYELEDVLKVML